MNPAALGAGLLLLGGGIYTLAGRAPARLDEQGGLEQLMRSRATPEERRGAEATGLPVAVVRGIAWVESRGKPTALRFEPHVFLRKRPDLIGRIPYTAGSGPSYVRSETDRGAFDRAFALDPRAAVESSSWGKYQAMGSSLLRLHVGDPFRAVAAFWANPDRVSTDLLIEWVRARGAAGQEAVRAAQAGDWNTLARIYNGPLYHRRSYQDKIAAAASSAAAQLQS